MKILAIDTATDACSAALLWDDAIIERYQMVPQQHAQLILPMVQELLQEAGITLNAIDAISFGRGPGSFTGLRIAHSVTQALAFATDIPVLPISTLLALVTTAIKSLPDSSNSAFFCAIDARMQEVYWACYQSPYENTFLTLSDEAVSLPEQIKLPTAKKWIGLGNGFSNYAILQQRFVKQLSKIISDISPRAAAIAKLAAIDFKAGKAIPATAAMPIYIRNQVTQQVKS